MAMKPDIHGMAIEIAAKKGFKPPGGDEPEGEPVSPELVDDAHEMIAAFKSNDGESFASALCNFLDKYHGDGDSEPPAEPEPSGPPEE